MFGQFSFVQILESLSFAHANVWEELGKLAALIVGARFIAYFCLRFLRREKLKFS